MKLVYVLFIALFIAVNAQDDCDERLRSVVEERDNLFRERDALVEKNRKLDQEADELFHEKEALKKEIQSGDAQRKLEEATQAIEHHQLAISNLEIEKQKLLKDIEDLRKSLDQSSTDREHFQKVAQENQHYMQEYKVRLATMRDKSAKLDLELESARAKIQELESATIASKIKTELASAYDSFLMLLGKHKEDESKDL